MSASYLDTSEITSAINSLSSKLNDKAALVNLYPVLKKATSSSEEPTPGYVYQELSEFSYESLEHSKYLVQYLNKRLQRPKVHGVLKTLKTMKQLTIKGSREFRTRLRENDEFIKGSFDQASQNELYIGTDILDQIKIISQELLVELFNHDLVIKDSSLEPEILPDISDKMTGMGGGSVGGKYEGFGHSSISKSSVTDTVRDMFESVVNIPDPKNQIRELCLTDSTGDYEPVILPKITSSRSRIEVKESKPIIHVPGRAGGGWDDSNGDDIKQINLISTLEHSDNFTDGIETTKEFEVINLFCTKEDSSNIVDDVEKTIDKIDNDNCLNAVFSIAKVLESGCDKTKLRGLIFLENYIFHGISSLEVMFTVYEKIYPNLQMSVDSAVQDKSEKIHLILLRLKQLKTNK